MYQTILATSLIHTILPTAANSLIYALRYLPVYFASHTAESKNTVQTCVFDTSKSLLTLHFLCRKTKLNPVQWFLKLPIVLAFLDGDRYPMTKTLNGFFSAIVHIADLVFSSQKVPCKSKISFSKLQYERKKRQKFMLIFDMKDQFRKNALLKKR